jgi:hypothetical protein
MRRPATDSNPRVAELEKKIAELTKALEDARAELARLQGRPAADAKRPGAEPKRPGRPGADAAPVPAELTTLMRQMINMSNDEATCRRIGEQMTQWAGNDAAKKKTLADYCKKVLELGYGNDAAKAVLRRLAGA